MKLVILSRNPKLYSTRRLGEEGEARGHEVRVVDYLRCWAAEQSAGPRVV